MRISTSKWLAVFAIMAVCFAITACASESRSSGEGAGELAADAAGGEPEGPEGTAEHAGPDGEGERGDSEAGEGEHGRTEGEGEGGDSGEGEGERAGSEGEGEGEHARSEGEGEHGGSEGEGEHGEEGGHDSGEEGEESGVYIARGETWDATRRGARLVLAFNVETNAFVGTVENTTEQTLCAVRVEVHLAGGTELGPTERTDVPAGESIEVTLATEGEGFDTWTAHPELSPCGG